MLECDGGGGGLTFRRAANALVSAVPKPSTWSKLSLAALGASSEVASLPSSCRPLVAALARAPTQQSLMCL